jgi:hypothetical protein
MGKFVNDGTKTDHLCADCYNTRYGKHLCDSCNEFKSADDFEKEKEMWEEHICKTCTESLANEERLRQQVDEDWIEDNAWEVYPDEDYY